MADNNNSQNNILDSLSDMLKRQQRDTIDDSISRLNELSQNLENAARSSSKFSSMLKAFNLFDDAVSKTESRINSLNNSIERSNKRINDLGQDLKRFDSSLDVNDIDKLRQKLESLKDELADAINQKTSLSGVTGKNALTEFTKLSKGEAEKVAEEYKKVIGFQRTLNELINDESDKVRTQTELYAAKSAAFAQGLSNIKSGFDKIISVGKGFLDVWGKIDQAASSYAKSVGASARGMDSMRKGSIEMVSRGHLAQLYGTTAQDIMAMSSKYVSQLGRNIQMGQSDIYGMAQMSRVLGSQEAAVAFGANMQRFGVSMEASSKIAGKMFKEAGKYGVSFEEYSKNFTENIRTAQGYTFKNGLNSFREMARKTTEMRLNMNQIFALSDKLSEGGIQTATEMGAQLQVLGGSFAQVSDPLKLLYQGISDVEGLTDTFKDMIKSSGFYNKNTGEFEVSTFDKLRLRAAAKSMGMDYNQVMESVNAVSRSEYIKDVLAKGSRTNFSQEDIAFISNTANVKNGQAFLSWFDEHGNRVEKSANEITAKEFAQYKIQNQSQTDDIKSIAVMLRGWDDVITGTKAQYENEKARAVEAVGLGQTVKSVADTLGRHTWMLNTIMMAVLGMSVARFGTSLSSGIGNMAYGLGKGPKVGGGGGGNISTAGGTTGGSTVVGGGPVNAVNQTPIATPKITEPQNIAKGSIVNFQDSKGTSHTYTALGENTFKDTNGTIGYNSESKRYHYLDGPRKGKMAATPKGASLTVTPEVSQNVAKTGFLKKAGGFAARNAGAISMIATLAGAGIDAYTQQGLASGKIKKGSRRDYLGSSFGKALAYGGMGAQIGSMFGPIGTAVGAGVGALIGVGIGIYSSEKRKRESDIEKLMGGPGLGVAQGRYSASELGKIRNALQKGNMDVLGDKLIDKMGEVGDYHVLERIGTNAKKGQGGIRGGITQTAGVRPRMQSASAIIPSVSPSTQQKSKVELSDLNINLNVNGNTIDGQQAGVLLAEELKRNPIMRQNISDMIAQQISYNDKGGNVVERYGRA